MYVCGYPCCPAGESLRCVSQGATPLPPKVGSGFLRGMLCTQGSRALQVRTCSHSLTFTRLAQLILRGTLTTDALSHNSHLHTFTQSSFQDSHSLAHTAHAHTDLSKTCTTHRSLSPCLYHTHACARVLACTHLVACGPGLAYRKADCSAVQAQAPVERKDPVSTQVQLCIGPDTYRKSFGERSLSSLRISLDNPAATELISRGCCRMGMGSTSVSCPTEP